MAGAFDSAQVAQALAEIKQLRHELNLANKAKSKAESRSEKLFREVTDLNEKNQRMQETILEMEQEGSLQVTSSERHLVKQNKQLNNQLQQQITVNKTLASKLMIS